MATRIIVFFALVAVLPALWVAVRARGVLARRRLVGSWTEPALADGIPTVLFFTGEHCSVCHFRQKPALERLKAERNGTLRVIELDAAREPDLARRFAVLSLPTTVVLAPDGRVGAVNYGFAPRDQLDAQLSGLFSP